jgi:hypothetical protein
MASFLDSLGWALCALFIGISMLIDSKLMNKEVRLPHTFKAYLVIGIGFFYLAYTFFAPKDFPKGYYYQVLTSIAIVMTIFAFLINKYYKTTEENLKTIIRTLFSFIFTETELKGYIKPEFEKEYKEKRIELVDKVVGNE